MSTGNGRGALRRGVITLAIGTIGGVIFFVLKLPLPWVLGSMTACAVCAQTTPFAGRLPSAWRGYALAAIGTMLGTGFTAQVVAEAQSWLPSLIVMSALSAAFFYFSYLALKRWGSMSPTTALFAAVPGGLSVVAALAEEYKVEADRVVLCHTARLIALLVTAPIALHLLTGIDLATANAASYSAAEDFDPLRHGVLLLVAVGTWGIAKRLPFPSGMLLLPLTASAILHATGLITVHVPPVLSSLAQVVIGAGVGARFANYAPMQILKDGWLAALIAFVLAAASGIAAITMAHVTDSNVAGLFLAYLPGGAPEIGVVALALSISPAFVAAHHILRLFVILFALPFAIKRVR